MRSRRGAARFPPTRPTSWRLYLDYQWPARVYQETRTRLEEIDQGFLEIGIRIRDYGYVYFRTMPENCWPPNSPKSFRRLVTSGPPVKIQARSLRSGESIRSDRSVFASDVVYLSSTRAMRFE